MGGVTGQGGEAEEGATRAMPTRIMERSPGFDFAETAPLDGLDVVTMVSEVVEDEPLLSTLPAFLSVLLTLPNTLPIDFDALFAPPAAAVPMAPVARVTTAASAARVSFSCISVFHRGATIGRSGPARPSSAGPEKHRSVLGTTAGPRSRR